MGDDDLLADEVVDGVQDEAVQDSVGHGDGVFFQEVEGVDGVLDHLVQVALDHLTHHLLVYRFCEEFAYEVTSHFEEPVALEVA